MFYILRARLDKPGLAANPDQVASPSPPFSSQMLVTVQAFDWKRVDPGSCKRALSGKEKSEIMDGPL